MTEQGLRPQTQLYITLNISHVKNEKISTEKQISDAKSKSGILTLEPTREAFLLGNRAMKDFVDGNDDEKRTIASKILWNLSMRDGAMAQVSYRSPYDIMANAPKTGDIKTLLAVWDVIRTELSR